jgi:peptidoglycan/LPS O-acetylase OafA/YrhL
MMNERYSQRTSAAITWLRFPLIFLIVMLHCYSVVKLDGNRDVYFKTLYPFSLWLGETGVPGFFFISGYLFFLSKKSYLQKLNTRIHTLLIPYLLWNAILLALYFIAYFAGYPQDINNKSIADYSLMDYLRLFWDRGAYDDGNFVPLLCPFWYIRNLLIMSVFSPILYYIIRYAREAFLLFAAIWWMQTYHNAFIPQTILFFSLGAYFSIHDVNPLKLVSENKKWFIVSCALFAIADIGMHTIYGTAMNLQAHRLALLFNIPILLLLADACTSKGYSNRLLPNAAFIVFAVHYPIVVVLRKICAAKFATASDATHILLYFFCIIIATAVSLLIYLVLAKYFPKLKNILSGNR